MSHKCLSKFLLTFSLNAVKYPVRDSRLPSHESAASLKQNDDCEVFVEGEAGGWCAATVKMIKGDFFVIDYKNTTDETKKNDIVASDRIRPPNRKY